MDICELNNRRWDMIAVKKDADKIFEFTLNPDLLPDIKIENRIDDMPCVVIADSIIISGIKMESDGLVRGYKYGFEIHIDWTQYGGNPQRTYLIFPKVRPTVFKALQLYINYTLRAYDAYEYCEQMG